MEVQEMLKMNTGKSIDEHIALPWNMYVRVAPNRRFFKSRQNLYKVAQKIHQEYFVADHSLWITEPCEENGFELYGLVSFGRGTFESYDVVKFRLGWYKVVQAVVLTASKINVEDYYSKFRGKADFRYFDNVIDPKCLSGDFGQIFSRSNSKPNKIIQF